MGKSAESTLNLFGEENFEDSNDKTHPPFSRLLEQACEHATKTKAVNIFESPALQAIVQCVLPPMRSQCSFSPPLFLLHCLSDDPHVCGPGTSGSTERRTCILQGSGATLCTSSASRL